MFRHAICHPLTGNREVAALGKLSSVGSAHTVLATQRLRSLRTLHPVSLAADDQSRHAEALIVPSNVRIFTNH